MPVLQSETSQFLPGAPEPGYAPPTTIYKTKRPLPRNILPADYYAASRGHSQLPLVFMLVFTQMSVGAFVIEQGLFSNLVGSAGGTLAAIRPMHLIAALLLAFLGMFAAVFHLGRPFYAYRALLGLKTSWLTKVGWTKRLSPIAQPVLMVSASMPSSSRLDTLPH